MTGDGVLWRRTAPVPTIPKPRLGGMAVYALGGADPVRTAQAPGKALDLEELIAALEALPAQGPVTLRVVAVADDPHAGSRQLAEAVVADVTLATRLLRMANSAYYGLSGRVSDLPFAVTVIGFATVRALAAAAAAGATADSGVPQGFWQRAATLSTAAGTVSGMLGAPASQAVCAGLLLDLGQALLYRCDPEGYPPLWQQLNRHGRELMESERGTYGIGHEQAAARVLAAWNFPDELVSAVAAHHDPSSATQTPLHRTLWVARQLAYEAINEEEDPEALPYPMLSEGAIDRDTADALVRRIRAESQGLAATLSM